VEAERCAEVAAKSCLLLVYNMRSREVSTELKILCLVADLDRCVDALDAFFKPCVGVKVARNLPSGPVV